MNHALRTTDPQQTATAMPMLPSRPPLWVCGGDTDARHLPISASSIIENSRKQPASSSRRWNYRAGAQLKCIGCCVLAPCDVEHCKPAARGLLSFLSLLRAFSLKLINANQKAVVTTLLCWRGASVDRQPSCVLCRRSFGGEQRARDSSHVSLHPS